MTERRFHEGTFYTLRRSKNRIWQITWTDEGRSKRKSTGETDLAKASAALGAFLSGAGGGGGGRALTCDEAWRAKHPGCEMDPKARIARGDNEGWIWRRIAPYFSGKAIRDVGRAEQRAFVDARVAAAAPGTVRLELARLQSTWRFAAKEGLISPCDLPDMIPLPKASPPRSRWLTDAECKRLVAAAEDTSERCLRFVVLALTTGARKSALADLTWDRVDLERGEVDLLPSGARQTSKRRPRVPISAALRPHLLKWSEDGADGHVIPTGADIYPWVVKAAEKAGVPGVSPHVLRHTAATHMARNGVPLWHIAGLLGVSTTMIEKVYAEHAPGAMRDAVERGAPLS